MKSKEWIEKNLDKGIEFKDGKLTVKEPEVKGRWKPTYGDDYYYIDSIGNVEPDDWDNWIGGKEGLVIGSAFRTKEEAEFARERLKIRAEMLDLGGREYFKPNEVNHRISYNHHTGRLVLDVESIFQDPFVIYFDREIYLTGVIEKIGETRIKKYLFGVDDEENGE